MTNQNRNELKYIIPHNFTENGRILGFIEKESAVSALVWFIPAAFLDFRFLPASLDIRIFLFILVVCPPTLLLLVGIGGEICIHFIRYTFCFMKRRKIHIYERREHLETEETCKR